MQQEDLNFGSMGMVMPNQGQTPRSVIDRRLVSAHHYTTHDFSFRFFFLLSFFFRSLRHPVTPRHRRRFPSSSLRHKTCLLHRWWSIRVQLLSVAVPSSLHCQPNAADKIRETRPTTVSFSPSQDHAPIPHLILIRCRANGQEAFGEIGKRRKLSDKTAGACARVIRADNERGPQEWAAMRWLPKFSRQSLVSAYQIMI